MIFFYLLISVLPLVQHPLWSQFVGELTVVKYLGIVCVLHALFYGATRATVPVFFFTRQSKFFLAFFVIATGNYLFKGHTFTWTTGYLTYLSLFIFFFITLTVVDSVERLRGVLLVAVGSVGIASLYVLREWQKFHTQFDSNYRPGWVTGDPNFFTISALACLPIALYLMAEKRPWFERAFCGGCLVVTLAAITLAASRGGFLGMSAAFLFVLWNSKSRIRNLAIIALVTTPILFIAPSSPIDRLLHPTHSDQESVEKRTTLWMSGYRMIESHPLTGVGLGNFRAVALDYQQANEQVQLVAHNSYIEIAAEMGLPALLVFVMLLVSSVQSLQTFRKTLPDSDFLHSAALGIQAAIIGCGLAIFFSSGQYQKTVWLMLLLSMVLPTLGTQKVSNESLEASAAPRAGELVMEPAR
jgi:hypothetical protein